MFYIITADNCPWCDKAIDYIQNTLGGDVTVYHYKEHPAIGLLMSKARMKTVPQIWFNKHHIGGYDDLTERFWPDGGISS